MDWFRKFMAGRYGWDHLSYALLIVSVIMTFTGTAAGLPLLALLSYIPLGATVFRMLSRNIQRRQLENYRFVMLMSPLYQKIKKGALRIEDSKTHRIFKCPNCKARLRVPRGKGKIAITCTKCRAEFIRKT